MKTPSVDQLIQAMRQKGYAVFDTPQGHNLNIVGIRARETRSNSFDDLLVVFYRLGEQWSCNFFPCTTDPGKYWLENPMMGLGTAILKPGQYRGAYEIGLHRGSYRALVQRRPVTVIRDNDRDDELDADGIEETGLFGLNVHCAGWKRLSILVDKWSAACQAIADWWDFQIFMAICEAAAEKLGNRFTYTLLQESDLTTTP